MEKKPGKPRGKARRTAATDLKTRTGGGVKGGEKASLHDLKIVKVVDKTTP